MRNMGKGATTDYPMLVFILLSKRNSTIDHIIKQTINHKLQVLIIPKGFIQIENINFVTFIKNIDNRKHLVC